MLNKKSKNDETLLNERSNVKKPLLKSKIEVEKKPKKEKEDQYFSKDTQEKLEEYKLAQTNDDRWNIYLNDIKPAFEMLVDKLVSVYGFKSFDDEMETMKADCVFFFMGNYSKIGWGERKKGFFLF